MGDFDPDPDELETSDSPGPIKGISRRSFLRVTGGVGGVTAYETALAHAKLLTNPALSGITHKLPAPLQSLLGEIESILSDTKPTFSLVMRRREDFLFLRVDGYNLIRSGQRLVRKIDTGAAYVVFTFEPQHLAEQAFPLSKKPEQPGRSQARLAQPSRIAFSLPAGKSIPLKLADLLEWSVLDPSLPPSAAFNPLARARRSLFTAWKATKPGRGGVKAPVHHRPPKRIKPPGFANPTDVQTAIELPWRLLISPTSVGGSWSHPKTVVESNGYVELWHTRLADSPDEAAPDGGTIRAVWNYDTGKHGKPTLASKTGPKANDESPFLTSLNKFDRWSIVRATSDFELEGRADVSANRLWLSTRGGFLDLDGHWDSEKFDLTEWRHQATLGRDQYVKVVYKGFLFPFGHRAVYTKISERQFEKVDGEIVATLRQYYYVAIREPTVSYDPSDTYGIVNDSRDFPFRSLTIKTPRTPYLETTPPFCTGSGFEGEPFVPTVNGNQFLWHFIGTDWLGQQAEFTAPAVFVYQQDGFNATNCTTVRNAYNALGATDATRIGNFTGQEVAFADSHTPGDTNHSVLTMTFGAGSGTGPASGGTQSDFQKKDQPICYPSLAQSINNAQAIVVLSAAAQASGGAALANPAVAYHPTFVSEGFNSSQNKGNLYLQILSGSPALTFSGASSGAVITPNLSLTGLSRSLGPVAGSLDNLLNGTFDPSSVFADALNATILGGVKLSTLIQAVTDISGDSPNAQAMQIVYSTGAEAFNNLLRSGEESAFIEPPVPLTRTTHLHWEPEISSTQSVPIVTSTGDTTFVLDGFVTANLNQPQNSTFQLTGNLTNFAVSLMENSGAAEFITINFNSLTFNSSSGQKSKVTVDIASVAFDGPLKFIEQLEEFMDFSGDGGPKITVLPTGISADLSVALPTIAVGVFSLSNIAVDAGFNLPFPVPPSAGGPARFRFSFSTQDNPFTLSVGIFGGGGFFGIAIGTDGVELIQASFDFGAMASIDLGVASGSVQLVAGIYFSYGENNGQPPTTCILTGFVKLDGSLSILDIVSLSLTFDLSLTYEDAGGISSVTGTATLTVSVSVLFFSFSVSVTATKTFGGGSSDSATADARRLLPSVVTGSDVPPNFQSQVSESDWTNYCNAFATN